MNKNIFIKQLDIFWNKAVSKIYNVTETDKEDIKQEIALSVWRSARKYHLNDQYAYLPTAFQTKLNEVLYDRITKAKKTNKLKTEYAKMKKIELERGCFDSCALVIKDVLKASKLTKKEGAVFSLRAFNDYTYAEISDLLHLSIGIVRRCYYKARYKIRCNLTNEDNCV